MSVSVIPAEVADRIYDVLVKHAGASSADDARQMFRIVQAEGCREYRFQGSLGFGGKFRNYMGRWYVDCYLEDETPARMQTIATTNEALAKLLKQTDGETFVVE